MLRVVKVGAACRLVSGVLALVVAVGCSRRDGDGHVAERRHTPRALRSAEVTLPGSGRADTTGAPDAGAAPLAVVGGHDGGGAPVAPGTPGTWVLHMVDVGTGLAIVVEGPDFTLIYDGGSNDDLADERANRLVSYLAAARPDLRRIDHVVLSHAHRDHVEFLPDVIDRWEVGAVWEPGVLAKVCAYQRFVHAIASHPRIAYHTAAHMAGPQRVSFPRSSCRVPKEVDLTYAAPIAEGAVVRLGDGATMRFLHVDGERRENLNENSLVVRLELGERSVLLPGDAEAGKRDAADVAPAPSSVEGKLVLRHAKELASDVLVAAHHGSRTSTRSAFLDVVAPKLTLVSGGPHPYASHTLPDPEVVELLRSRGPVFRTDVDDAACASSKAKIGRDADGRPGGCDNVRVTFRKGEAPRAEYFRGHD